MLNPFQKHPPGRLRAAWVSCVLLGGLTLTGCGPKVVYNRSVADLNQKAQTLIQAGDAAGAISRLESALDLNPDEPNTLYNLAIAYEAHGDLDKAITTFETLLQKAPSRKAEVSQSLGVIYERKADEALEALGQEKAADKAQLLQRDVVDGYQRALQAYRDALPALKDPAEVQVKITWLEGKLREIEAKSR